MAAHPMLDARREQMFPTLGQAEIDRLRRFGELKFYEKGERILRAGEVAPGLILILSGKVEITQGFGTDQREIIVTHQAGQFVGELAQLSAHPSLVDGEAVEDVQALVIPSARLRDLLVQEADLGERIMRALICVAWVCSRAAPPGRSSSGAQIMPTCCGCKDFLPETGSRIGCSIPTATLVRRL